MRVAQGPQERTGAAEAEADAEPAAGRERLQRLVVVGGWRGVGRHSRVSSSS